MTSYRDKKMVLYSPTPFFFSGKRGGVRRIICIFAVRINK